MNFTPGAVYNAITTSGYAVIIDADQYYVSMKHFRRLKDAVTFASGAEPERRGHHVRSLTKPRFAALYRPR
jgi:hypothetical protein